MIKLDESRLILIDKVYSGQASTEEFSLLETWREAFPEHENAYRKQVEVLELISKLEKWNDFNEVEGWSKVSAELRTKSLRIRWKSMAAAAILLLVFATTFWNFNDDVVSESGVFIAGNDTKFSVLSDGSEVFLEQDSRIYTNEFSSTSRTISTVGDFFVNVEHDKEHPFFIKTGELSIKVLGTSFSVEEEEGETSVKVRDGKVLITSNDGAVFSLLANEVLTIKNGDVKIERLRKHDWNLYSKTFEDEPVLSVIEDLSSRFGNLEIDLSEVNSDCKITTKIDQSTIIEILREIALIFDVDYTIKEGIIVVNKISC